MANLSSADLALLEADLPPPVRLEVDFERYATGRGYVELRATGPAHAPVIVCLHGIGSSSAGYRAQFAGLSHRFRVIAWNAPGFGASTPLAMAEPHADDYAELLLSLLDRLQCTRMAILVGSSWGSVIAMAFAARHPERLERLVLSAPNTARGRLTGKARDDALARMLESGSKRDEASRDAVVARLLPPDAPLQVRERVAVLRDAVTADGWPQAVRMLFSVHTPSVVGGIQCPIDMLAGARDTLAPIDQHALPLCAAAPWIRLHVFEDCAHMLKLEAPTRFNSIVTGTAPVAD
ncbi:alpha/beta hydrolase [Paraburkholderia phytofirmans]|uniref:alpha/beta fold hydrolase n=1 Tax=Paraburkholderia phytofirmans TaxID=261302 RepID=UPI0038B7E28F